jgi:hypothetical protein
MAKRATGLGGTRPKVKKTLKRLTIKREMLAARASKKIQKGIKAK